MAVASDYSGWVRELDKFQASADGGDVDNDDYDPRHESSNERGLSSSRQTSRTVVGIATSRKGKERVVSQTDELQQEMKLLNWHKLANEAALKAAIIKTNKIKREDSQFSQSMNHEDMEDKQLRIQQIIEEEQLRPLEVNSEFFRDFETKELQDEVKLDNDVQRHVQHLKKLKETMAQREDLQRRRQKYREGMLELTGSNSRSNSVPKNHKSNQDDERHEQQNKRHQRSNSMYNNRSTNGGTSNTQVICSLDKLMELEKRIRHLEDAGLGADGLEDDPRVEHGSRGGDELEESSLVKTKGGGLHFSKRRSNGGPHEPSKTVYAVKKTSSSAFKVNKMRAKEKPKAAPSLRQSRQPQSQGTFLTSLPESKQRQLRRMSERERRQFFKNEKASEEREKNLKQDVVIDGWLDKKRQAASNRKAANTHVRTAQTGGGGTRDGGSTMANGHAAANTTTKGRRLGGKTLPPPPPKVRAPAAGAASGKRISNPHSQRFDDIKKGFEKRNEALKRAPTNLKVGNSFLDARSVSGSSAFHSGSSNQKPSGGKWGSTVDRSAASSTSTQRGTGILKASTLSNASMGKGLTPTAPIRKTPSGTTPNQKLPAIVRASGVSTGGPQFGLTNRNPIVSVNRVTNLGPHTSQRTGGALGVALPRLVGQATRAPPAPSPPPLALKNSSMPQFSRLHKR